MEIRDAELEAEQLFKAGFPKYAGQAVYSRGQKDREGNILVLCEAFHPGTDDAIAGDVAVYHFTDEGNNVLYVTQSA